MAKLNTRKRGKTWEYRFEGAQINGKRNQITKGGFRTKKEAEIAGNKALVEYNNSGLHFKPNEISVADYLDYWFNNYCKVELKYNTQMGYLGIINNHLKPNFGQYKLKTLNPTMLQEFINKLKLNGLSKSSIVGIVSTFSTALKHAVHPYQFIKDNPLNYVKIPKIDKPKKTRIILSTDDINLIINRFPEGNRFYIPLLIGWNCGLRISETFALTWDDIDFDNKTLTVNKQVVKRNLGLDINKVTSKKRKPSLNSFWHFSKPKYGSNRTIKIGDSLIKELKKEKTRQLKNEMLYGGHYTVIMQKIEKDEKGNNTTRLLPIQKGAESSLPRAKMICVTENGEYTSPDSFKYCSRVIHYELKLAFNYHALRHTHATLLIENGVSPKTVQNRLGHKQIETTLQTYVHDTPTMEENAINIFEQNINSALSTS